MDIITYLNRQTKSFLMVLGITLVILIGIVNYLEAVMTKGELSFSIFYLLPIFIVAWFVNIKAGIIVSFLSAIVWEVTDFMAGHVYSNPVIPYWNTAVRLVFFLIVAIMLSRLRIISSKLSKSIEQLQLEIVERTKAQEALNKQRERLISVLIHNLKGPLVPVQGFTKRLIDGKAKSKDDAIKMLKIIQDSSQELLKTIENTSKDLREKLTLESFHTEDIDFKDILLSIVISSMPEMESKGIDILINSKSRESWNDLEGAIFKADPSQLKTLIENLIGNAIKYAESTINVELNKNDSHIRFVISDDGTGIPEEYHKEIFEEYFQVPGSKKGTGIGLYSVKKTVENHKGKITVHSSSNEGASFEIIFPY